MLSVIFIIFLCLFVWLVIFVGFAARGNQENQKWNNGICKETGTPWQRCASLDYYDYHAYIASVVRPWKIHSTPKKRTFPIFGQCINHDNLNHYLWIDPVRARRQTYGHYLESESIVTVTQTYISNSLRNSPTQCALAMALHNDMDIRTPAHYDPVVNFVVTHDLICLLEDIGQSKLLLESIIIEANLRQWLNDYDEHRDVKPMQICITRYKPPGFDSTPLIADILSLI